MDRTSPTLRTADWNGKTPHITEDNLKDFTGERLEFDANKQMLGEEIEKLIITSKIDLLEPLSPPPVAMQINSAGVRIALFTKGNFSIVTGAAKSRKTFFLSMLMAAAIKGSFEDFFFCPARGTNILFDTEQNRYKAQQIGKRICNLTEQVTLENLVIYSLRTLDPLERLVLIEKVLETTPNLNIVAIDGIIDLENDPILQADQAQKIVSKLMRWTEIYNIHIICVLHYNKTAPTLLGHLGSFSHRKADAIISVTKSKDDQTISLVEAVDCRELEFKSFAFSVDNFGLPYILHDYTFEKKKQGGTSKAGSKKRGLDPPDLENTQHADILACAFSIQKVQGYGDLWRNIKNSIFKITNSKIGDNKAKDFITYYLAEETIIKSEVPKKAAAYTLAGQMAIPM